MQTNFTSFLFRNSSPVESLFSSASIMWQGLWPHSVAWGRTRCVCVCVCVGKYAQTFVIYVIRSVNRMMAARRIGFTLLKSANSTNSSCSSGCGHVQAKLHRRRLLPRPHHGQSKLFCLSNYFLLVLS